MKEEIKTLIEKEGIYKIISKDFLKNNYIEFYQELFSFKNSYLKEREMSNSQLLYLYLNDLKEIPQCYCGNELGFLFYSKGFKKYCSNKCSVNSEERKEKGRKTCIEKYDVDNPFKSKEIIQSFQEKNLKTFGTKFPSQSLKVKEKVSEYFLDKYGFKNPSQVDKIKEKRKETFFKNFNVDNPYKSFTVKEKIKEILLEKYNVDSPHLLRRKNKNSRIELEICKQLKGEKFKYKDKVYDFKIGNDIFEIDGDFYHPLKIENLYFTQLNNILNDYIKQKNLIETEFTLNRILVSTLPVCISELTVEVLKSKIYTPNYSIEDNTMILSKEYIEDYLKKNGEIKLKKYIPILISFCKELGKLELDNIILRDRINYLIENNKDFSLKNVKEVNL